MILLYIPTALCELYHAQGWTVTALRCHHGAYSMLASRPAFASGYGGAGS